LEETKIPLLRLKNVVVRYGGALALNGVSLEIEQGTLATIIGSNGAGKTTILYTISGLAPLTKGEIWFQGQRIEGLSAHKVSALSIALVFGGRRVFPYMSVRDNLLVGAHLCTKKNTIDRRLKEVEGYFPRLRERMKQQAGSLSGGEQQMLAIGRALMADPELLLLDEPSLGLSPLVVQEVVQIIRKIFKERGKTILLVEQNAKIALRLASKGYVLQSGNIMLEGRGNELLQNEMVKKAYLGV
jgi:branched-chain amino acid transport system ATP-binding protein